MRQLSFKTNARHIGQLGRELVTDFVTALVELIKNSYDADAYGVKIILENPNTPQSRLILVDIGSGMTQDDFENKWMVIGTNNKVSEPYTPKGRKKAGKKGIGRFSVERLAERVKIYSFPKKEHAFRVDINWNDFEDLNTGAIVQKIAVLKNNQESNAAKYIYSQIDSFLGSNKVSEEDKRLVKELFNVAELNYQSFFNNTLLDILQNQVVDIIKKYECTELLIGDVSSQLNIINSDSEAEAFLLLNELYQDCGVSNNGTGMILIMEGLRDDWKQRDIDKLQKELRLLVAPDFIEKDPFKVELSAPDFKVDEIVLVNDILDLRFAKVDARIFNKGTKKEIIYCDNNGNQKKVLSNLENPLLCGDIKVELYYFIRDTKHLSAPGSGYNFRFSQRILDTYCGIKIYRDNFRVKPYGDIGNDWLLLDQAKVKDTHGYLVGNNQVIGVVKISDETNPSLVDATNREGIIENEAYVQLKDFVKECTNLISAVRMEDYKRTNPDKISQLKDKKKKLDESLSNIADSLNDAAENKENLDHIKRQYDEYYESVEDAYQEKINFQESELNLYKNLASLGILTGSFGHETSDIVSRIKTSLILANVYLENDNSKEDIKVVLDIIDKDFSRIFSYTGLIDEFLRKKKRKINPELSFEKTLDDVCKFYKQIINSFDIDLIASCESDVLFRMAQIDLESIIINMITNAFEQVKGKSVRIISVNITQNMSNIILSFEDSGDGVPKDKVNEIFKPFITSKEDGIGLGLNIVKDIVDKYKGIISVLKSENYGGAKFEVVFPKGEGDKN